MNKLENGLEWLFLQFGMSLFIAITNGVTALIFMLIAKLMKRTTISSELKEAALGVFIMQVLNMAWLAFLSSIDSVRKIWGYYTPPSSTLFKALCENYDISK